MSTYMQIAVQAGTCRTCRMEACAEGMWALTEQQGGRHEEQRGALRLAVADALLEGHARHRREEGPDGPHRARVPAHVLRDCLRLQWPTAAPSGIPRVGAGCR